MARTQITTTIVRPTPLFEDQITSKIVSNPMSLFLTRPSFASGYRSSLCSLICRPGCPHRSLCDAEPLPWKSRLRLLSPHLRCRYFRLWHATRPQIPGPQLPSLQSLLSKLDRH